MPSGGHAVAVEEEAGRASGSKLRDAEDGDPVRMMLHHRLGHGPLKTSDGCRLFGRHDAGRLLRGGDDSPPRRAASPSGSRARALRSLPQQRSRSPGPSPCSYEQTTAQMLTEEGWLSSLSFRQPRPCARRNVDVLDRIHGEVVVSISRGAGPRQGRPAVQANANRCDDGIARCHPPCAVRRLATGGVYGSTAKLVRPARGDTFSSVVSTVRK
jgi:hypothetical protein